MHALAQGEGIPRRNTKINWERVLQQLPILAGFTTKQLSSKWSIMKASIKWGEKCSEFDLSDDELCAGLEGKLLEVRAPLLRQRCNVFPEFVRQGI